MANYDYNIDELFGESARQYKSDAPDGMWDALDADLDRRNRRKAIFWMRIAAGVAIVITAFGAGYYLGNSPKEQVNPGIAQVDSAHDQTRSDKVEVSSGNAGVGYAEGQVNGSSDEIDGSSSDAKGGLVSSQENSGKAGEEERARIGSGDSRKAGEKGYSTETREQLASNQAGGRDTDGNSIETGEALKQNMASVNSSKAGENEQIVIASGGFSEVGKELQHSIASVNSGEAREHSAVPSTNDDQPQFAESLTAIPEDHSEENQDEQSNILLVADPEKVQIISGPPMEPIKCKGCSPWTIAVEGAPVIAFREATGSPTDPQPGNNTGTQSLTESLGTDAPRWGWAGGVKVAYQGHPKWQFKTGMNFHQMGQEADAAFRMSDPNPTSSVNTLIGTTSAGTVATSLSSSESIGSYESISTTDGEVLKAPVDQQFSYLEVPLTATYLIGNGKLKMGLEGGLAGNFLLQNQVSSWPEGDVVIGSTEGARDFLWSAVGGVQLAAQLNSNMSLTVGPQVRYGLQSVSNDAYFKPYSLGLSAGLAYRL